MTHQFNDGLFNKYRFLVSWCTVQLHNYNNNPAFRGIVTTHIIPGFLREKK
jgi:hypothetical protein